MLLRLEIRRNPNCHGFEKTTYLFIYPVQQFSTEKKKKKIRFSIPAPAPACLRLCLMVRLCCYLLLKNSKPSYISATFSRQYLISRRWIEPGSLYTFLFSVAVKLWGPFLNFPSENSLESDPKRLPLKNLRRMKCFRIGLVWTTLSKFENCRDN